MRGCEGLAYFKDGSLGESWEFNKLAVWFSIWTQDKLNIVIVLLKRAILDICRRQPDSHQKRCFRLIHILVLFQVEKNDDKIIFTFLWKWDDRKSPRTHTPTINHCHNWKNVIRYSTYRNFLTVKPQKIKTECSMNASHPVIGGPSISIHKRHPV